MENSHIYHISANKWYPMRLKTRKTFVPKTIKPGTIDRNSDLIDNLALITGEVDTAMPDQRETTEEKPRHTLSIAMPQPRFNASLAILDDTLFIYGGTYERGDREYILDSLYSIDLGRLDGVRTIYDKTDESIWIDSDETDEDEEWEDDTESDDDDDDEEEEDNEEVNPLDMNNIDVPVDDETSNDVTVTTDLKSSLYPLPDPFETLKHYYQRCSPRFIEVQLQQSANPSRGKELRRDVFAVVEEHYWSMREEVRNLEEQLEESGVGDIVVGGLSTRRGVR